MFLVRRLLTQLATANRTNCKTNQCCFMDIHVVHIRYTSYNWFDAKWAICMCQIAIYVYICRTVSSMCVALIIHQHCRLYVDGPQSISTVPDKIRARLQCNVTNITESFFIDALRSINKYFRNTCIKTKSVAIRNEINLLRLQNLYCWMQINANRPQCLGLWLECQPYIVCFVEQSVPLRIYSSTHFLE